MERTDASIESLHPALARLVRDGDVADALAMLSERLAGADLTTLLMAVARNRASALNPSDVLGQYQHDRFVTPASVDVRRLRAVEDVALDEAAALFEFVIASPLAPLGAHSVIAGVSQNNLVTTIRSTEVAADPTNTLALEAAVRRRELLDDDLHSAVPVRLAAFQRVVRAQRFDGPRSFAHFELLGAVTAGRDVGNHSFEVEAIVEHIRTMSAIVRRAGVPRVQAVLSDLDGRFAPAVGRVIDALDQDEVETIVWQEREAGRGYYPDLCFKLLALIDNDDNSDAEAVEVGDGGLVAWTQMLLQNRKERLMISGLSVERIASIVRG